MSGWQRMTLLGNLGRDPESRNTKTGEAVCTLAVATSYRRKDGTEETEWHRVSVFGAQAEACQRYLAKGRQVLVEGRLKTETWTDKEGAERRTTGIIADRVVFVGRGQEHAPGTQQGRGQGAGWGDGQPSRQGAQWGQGGDDDGLPF